ncbi:MAG: CCA tRNA nucleotidyltransferase, partial [Proteobacteria bacterium]|nr:CCA tRNA nucleotidyltransferase [Pseudomonadota bacterium]
MTPTGPAGPAGKIPLQDWMRAPATRAVIAALTAEGAEVRFVGGCVRDALARREVRDIDIATKLAPAEVMRLLEAAGLKAIPTGVAHGTVTAVAHGEPFQITTLRVDVETYGRRARVAFTDDWIADAARRDFTFNALSCGPDGTYYDPFDGAADLAAGRVRFVGEARARIEEDTLRLLRFFRFQAHFGKQPPDPEILEVAAALAPSLAQLSGERVRDELFRLLEAPDPLPVVEILIARRILRAVVPTLGDAALLRALLRVEARSAPIDPVLRLAALVAPGRAGAEALAERLRLLRSHGTSRDGSHVLLGTTSRLDAIQAALLRSKLPYLKGWTEARVRNARVYAEELADCPGVEVPQSPQGETVVWNQFTLRCRQPTAGTG